MKNKQVLVARRKNLAKSFSEIVKGMGGIPVEIPLLAFRPREITPEIQSKIDEVSRYDWIIFTSNVSVETFLSYVELLPSQFPQIAAIGKKTAKVLTDRGLTVEFIPTEYVAEAFVEEFAPLVQKGTKILIPKGNLARDYIAKNLIELGAEVDEVIVYETYFPPESKAVLKQKIEQQELDIIPFTSPSTVDYFMEVIHDFKLADELSSFIFACIGPVAKKRAEEYGLPVHVVPSVYTVEEMMKEIAHYILKLK
ncbi:uroporphyrinogen-III synthase [Niallia sp. Krafla_26]|uniref:uroporphyrinogen-III synthase n=1 Tax=Niallia sp. Krafla_26 TaxID=3064703 RepID=UPI003D16B892